MGTKVTPSGGNKLYSLLVLLQGEGKGGLLLKGKRKVKGGKNHKFRDRPSGRKGEGMERGSEERRGRIQ